VRSRGEDATTHHPGQLAMGERTGVTTWAAGQLLGPMVACMPQPPKIPNGSGVGGMALSVVGHVCFAKQSPECFGVCKWAPQTQPPWGNWVFTVFVWHSSFA